MSKIQWLAILVMVAFVLFCSVLFCSVIGHEFREVEELLQ